MYETFYGFQEKPFSLTPDPRYFYPSPCHANALELVQHGSQSPWRADRRDRHERDWKNHDVPHDSRIDRPQYLYLAGAQSVHF